MSMQRPDVLDSPYVNYDVDKHKYYLLPSAPKNVIKEFEEYMESNDCPEVEPLPPIPPPN